MLITFMHSPKGVLFPYLLFIAREPVADENIQADRECQHKAEETQGGDTQKLGAHVCRTDNAGTDQQSHYPEAHDDIADQSPQQIRHLSGGIELHIDLGLPI